MEVEIAASADAVNVVETETTQDEPVKSSTENLVLAYHQQMDAVLPRISCVLKPIVAWKRVMIVMVGPPGCGKSWMTSKIMGLSRITRSGVAVFSSTVVREKLFPDETDPEVLYSNA